MLHRTSYRLGILSSIKTELLKIPSYMSYQIQEKTKDHVESASKTIDFLKGGNPNDSPEVAEKRRKHKEMYDAILRAQASKAQEEKDARQAELQHLPWKDRLKSQFSELKYSMSQATSVKAGSMALLQHCTASHAAEVAIEQGIDVKNVNMVLEKREAPTGVGYEEVVVGYIDAPSASQEEVMAFAQKLEKACPVASRMTIDWRSGRESSGSGLSSEDRWPPAGGVGGGAEYDGAIPAGMPGSRQYQRDAFSSSARGKGDGFHLPGVPSPRRTEADDLDRGNRNDSVPAGMPGSRRGSSDQNTPK